MVYIHNKMKYSEFSRHVQIIFQTKRKEGKKKVANLKKKRPAAAATTTTTSDTRKIIINQVAV